MAMRTGRSNSPIGAPAEEPLDQDQQGAGHLRRGALPGEEDFQHVELGDFADRALSPMPR